MRTLRRTLADLALVCLIVGMASGAAAQQTGRLAGNVRDPLGRPVRGAAIHAKNPDTAPAQLDVTTDARGNWAMLGLHSGVWEITASAPGFETSTITASVSSLRQNPDVQFVLIGAPVHGALETVDTKALQADLSAAGTLMASQQWDAAIEAYQAILAKAPPLTTVNLAIGRALRMKKDFAGAEAAYGNILKADSSNQKALLELGRCQQEAGDRTAAVATLEKLLAIDGRTPEAADARTLIAQLKR
jgi:tetratricopeptide (TPR) repeat protein